MKTVRLCACVVAGIGLVGANFGCMGRAISEGLGVVTGASGKVVEISKPGPLAAYRGLRVESLTVTPGLKTPPNLTSLVREEMVKVAAKKKLSATATPALLVSGEVTNYETADAVDTAIGPLEECIIRAQLMDGESKEVISVVNLVARAKSTTAGGEKNLSEAIGKALSKWLKAGGIKTEEEEKEERKD